MMHGIFQRARKVWGLKVNPVDEVEKPPLENPKRVATHQQQRNVVVVHSPSRGIWGGGRDFQRLGSDQRVPGPVSKPRFEFADHQRRQDHPVRNFNQRIDDRGIQLIVKQAVVTEKCGLGCLRDALGDVCGL